MQSPANFTSHSSPHAVRGGSTVPHIAWDEQWEMKRAIKGQVNCTEQHVVLDWFGSYQSKSWTISIHLLLNHSTSNCCHTKTAALSITTNWRLHYPEVNTFQETDGLIWLSQETERTFHIHSNVHCMGAHPFTVPFSRKGLKIKYV